MVDEDLLDEVTRISGEKTYSGAIRRAMEEFVRRARARQILTLRGCGLWEGGLGEMRRDEPPDRSEDSR